MKILNQSPLKAQQGFTLIELVVVIVILGILAATAAPKFIDLTGDAKASTIQALRGSIESATTMIHAKALISGETNDTGGLDLDEDEDEVDEITLVNGWPSYLSETWDEILDISEDDFLSVVDATEGKIVWYHFKTDAYTSTSDAEDDNCFISYTVSADSNTRPEIEVDPDGC